MKKTWQYVLVGVLCSVLILSGIYCSITWFKHSHRTSHVYGSLYVNNNITQDNLKFSNAKNPIVFYPDDYEERDAYYFDCELPAVPSFDGTKKQYEITLNDYLVLEPTILFRTVSFRMDINFKDVDTSILCETYFEILVKFYVDKTEFKMTVIGERNKQFVEHYIEWSGFELYINEIVGGINE